MKMTESHLRKIIRGAINEMFSGADPTISFHDSPQEQQPSEMADKSSAEIADHILSQYQLNSKVDDNLLSLLKQISQKEEDEKSGTTSSSGLDMSKLGLPMGENKKRR